MLQKISLMNLLIDTGTWLKLDLLKERKLFDPAKLYEWATIKITHEVEEELVHFQCNSWERTKTHIVPVEDQRIYNDAINANFDVADASILSLGKREDLDTFIISEDRPLLDYARMTGLIIGLLADFFQVCDAMEWLSHRELYRLVKALHSLKNITKKKVKYILAWRARQQG